MNRYSSVFHFQTIPSNDAMRRTIQRIRSLRYPAYTDLEHPIIDGEWGQTIEEDPQQILIADNHGNNPWVLVFASKQRLQTLDKSQTLYLDGNFEIAPPDFTPIYIIRVELGSKAVTAVFALLQWTQEAYAYLLNTVEDSCVANRINYPKSQKTHVDFEKAAYMVICNVYPGAEIKGCFYHLCQVSI